MEFVRRELKGALPRPDWWLVRPDEIIAQCENVKKGRKEIAAYTPGGFPVYVITYGPERPVEREINWPSATGSPRPELYTLPGPQCLMIIGGVHGEEPEGVMAVLNLMSLMETGKDLAGNPNPELVKLAENYRLILMPCINMDGRAISPDCYVGGKFEDFADLVYTRLKDGTQLRWPQLKEYYPMPMDQVERLGTYYNSEGYNIQLDAAPGNICTEEAKAILRVAAREHIDLFVNLHSDGCEHIIVSASLHYPVNIETCKAIRKVWLKVRGYDPETDYCPSTQTDIDNAVELATGAPSFTFEFGLTSAPSHERLVDEGYGILEAVFRYGVDNVFADRRKIAGKE